MSDCEDFEEKLRKFRLDRESKTTEVSIEDTPRDMSFRQGGRSGRGGGGNRPPGHLKGKQIGLYYRDLKRDKSGAMECKRDGLGPWRAGKDLQRQKNREQMAYEGGEGGSDANRFKRFGDSRDDEVVTGGNRDRPPGLRGSEIGQYYRNKQKQKNREKEKRKAVDITIPRWQIQEIRTQLKLGNGSENVDFFKHFVQNDDINSVFKNEYLRVIRKSLDQILHEESLKKEEPLEALEIDFKDEINEGLYKEYLRKQENEPMRDTRRRLPAFGSQRDILRMIDKHQVILVKGETGSGKTTQIPQFILDHAMEQRKGVDCRIICTQPRRISAITLSERVAAERGERLGSSIGYQIRLDAKKPRNSGGSILFCTTGIVLSIMQGDPCLKDYSHLILDEIHERDVTTDLLLGVVKKILPYRKDLKVILMSATLTAETFSRYFNNCPTVEIPGLSYPVEEFYLEDVITMLNYHKFDAPPKKNYFRDRQIMQFFDMIDPYLQTIQCRYPAQVLRTLGNPNSESSQNEMIVELIFHITSTKPDGAILAFFPSLAQISAVHKLLMDHRNLGKMATLIYPLHSKVPQLDQKAVFSRPPRGTRKIILATNIAETSITIDDVVYVVNTGRQKINMYENGISTLRDEWSSLANEIQRKGRAGRVQPGVCYHLYTKARRNVLLQNTPPEILRVALEEVILNIKILGLGEARQFMAYLLDQPSDEIVEGSLELLNRLNAIDDDQVLTPLGYHLARLPMDPRTGKMILLSSIFSCTDPISSIAASLSFKDAFYKPFGKEREVDAVKRRLAQGCHSDHLMLANVIHEWKELSPSAAQHFAYKNFLNVATLNQLYNMKGQFCDYLYSSKFLEQPQIWAECNNRNSGNDKLLTAIIGAGLYPNVAFVRRVFKKRDSPDGRSILAIEGQGRATMHPTSVNSTLANFESNFVVYYDSQKLAVSGVTIFDTTVVNPFPLFFFGDNHVETDGGFEYISIAGHYCLKCDKETYRLIQDLREGFNIFLQKKICYPSPVNWSLDEGTLLRAIIQLITIDGMYEDGFDDDDFMGGPSSSIGSADPEEIPLGNDEDTFDYFENDDLPPPSTSRTKHRQQ